MTMDDPGVSMARSSFSHYMTYGTPWIPMVARPSAEQGPVPERR